MFDCFFSEIAINDDNNDDEGNDGAENNDGKAWVSFFFNSVLSDCFCAENLNESVDDNMQNDTEDNIQNDNMQNDNTQNGNA